MLPLDTLPLPPASPPRLGEHGGQVLRDGLGYDEAAIQRLREQRLL